MSQKYIFTFTCLLIDHEQLNLFYYCREAIINKLLRNRVLYTRKTVGRCLTKTVLFLQPPTDFLFNNSTYCNFSHFTSEVLDI